MASEQTGSSTSAFVTSLIFNLIIFSIFVLVFVCLRNKYLNVYRPRTINRLLPNHLQAPPLAHSAFGWLPDLLTRPDSFIIQHAGVDGYFFLRYLRIWAYIGVLCGIFLWPILFAVNATGGGNQTGFNIISYANNTHKWRVFANLFCSWLFFGVVIYTIYSELVFYIGFRHHMQTTPFFSSLPSSKVLLIDNVDEGLLFEDSLRRLFPAAQRIAITKDTSKARDIYDKRTKLVGKLEGAFTKVISKCVKMRSSLEKKLEKGKQVELPSPISKIESYIPEKKMPTYKYKPIIGESKPVFDDGINELNEFTIQLSDCQKDIEKSGDKLDKLGSVFLEFSSHLELQRAYQAIENSEHFKKSRRFQSFFPDEVIWPNVGVSYLARKSKKSGSAAFLTLMIIFWAIPVAVVGCISNINYLTEKVHFLRFINNMPSFLMGIITGILPSVLLAILMSLVPPIIKYFGKKGGVMTIQQLDFWTQQWYFAFQVIQVFLVTTCTSAASSVVTSIINDPSNAMTMLAANLPPASNFYICYMLLQGLSISSGLLAQVVGLILSFVLGRILDKTPRQKWTRDISLATPSWGVLYASFGLFTVILLCYAVIAPIIIAFTSIAFLLIYVAELYTFVYVSGHSSDNRGRNYPLALFEVFVGVYLGEICLLALFVMQKNWACVVLEAVWLALSVLAHLWLRWKFELLLDTVPISVTRGYYPNQDMGKNEVIQEGKGYFVEDEEKTIGAPSDGSGSRLDQNSTIDSFNHNGFEKKAISTKDNNTLAETQASTIAKENEPFESAPPPVTGVDADQNKFIANQDYVTENDGVKDMLNPKDYFALLKESLLRYFKPQAHVQYSNYKPMMPGYWELPIADVLTKGVVYQPPEITDIDAPVLWIAKDALGISEEIKEECDHAGVECSDADAIYNKKGKVEISGESFPPGYEASIMY